MSAEGEWTAALFDVVGSPGFERDKADLHALLGAMYDRGHDPGSVSRQLGAIVASGNRTAELRRITAPTLVIHGTQDRLVNASGPSRSRTRSAASNNRPRTLWMCTPDGIVSPSAPPRLNKWATAH